MTIRAIPAADAHPLRRAVLRRGLEHTDVHFPQDDMPESFHLGYFEGDELVGVASFSPNPSPFRPDAAAWQLRGMAVADDRQGQGIGQAIIGEAIERVRAAGATVLWCNARDTAQRFYERLGFVVYGEGFTTKDTGLPHHVMVRDL